MDGFPDGRTGFFFGGFQVNTCKAPRPVDYIGENFVGGPTCIPVGKFEIDRPDDVGGSIVAPLLFAGKNIHRAQFAAFALKI